MYFILIVLFILMSWWSSAIAALPLNQHRRTHRQFHNDHSIATFPSAAAETRPQDWVTVTSRCLSHNLFLAHCYHHR